MLFHPLAKSTLLIVAGFAVVVAILVLVTVIGLDSISAVNRQLRTVVEENNVKAALMDRMSDAIRERLLDVYTIVNLDDPFAVEQQWEHFTLQASTFMIARNRLYALGLNDAQTRQIEAQKNILGAAQTTTNQVINLARAGNREAAGQYLADARAANNDVLRELAVMRAFQEDLAQQAVQDAGRAYQATRRQVLMLLALGTFVCVTIIVFVVWRIDTQRQALEDARQGLERRVAQRTGELMAAQQENLRMGAELQVSRRLQQMLLPGEAELDDIKELDLAGFMEAAAEVGGDYYDVLRVGGRIKIGIGDVTGHGLESGVLMLMVQTTVRTLQESGITDPRRFMDVLNKTIYQNVRRMGSDKMLTLALLDYHEGTVRLCGQHEEVLVVRASGAIERIDTIDLGFLVGLKHNILPFLGKREIELAPGDGLVLYTDGITEAFDSNDRQYGIERLCALVQAHWPAAAKDIRNAIIADVRRHLGSRKPADDITLLVAKRPDAVARAQAA